jgi:tetratricopeptide (TPR) repeat protein
MRGQLWQTAGHHARALADYVEALNILIGLRAAGTATVAQFVVSLKQEVGEETFGGLWTEVIGKEPLPDWLRDPNRLERQSALEAARGREEQEEWAGASEAYGRALSLFDRRRMSEAEWWEYAETALRLGTALRQEGGWSPAVERLQDAFRAFQKLGNFDGQGRAFLELARAYRAMQLYDQAILHYRDAARLFRRAGDPAMAAGAREEAGNLQLDVGLGSAAVADLEAAARLYAEAGVPSRVDLVQQALDLARAAAGSPG